LAQPSGFFLGARLYLSAAPSPLVDPGLFGFSTGVSPLCGLFFDVELRIEGVFPPLFWFSFRRSGPVDHYSILFLSPPFDHAPTPAFFDPTPPPWLLWPFPPGAPCAEPHRFFFLVGVSPTLVLAFAPAVSLPLARLLSTGKRPFPPLSIPLPPRFPPVQAIPSVVCLASHLHSRTPPVLIPPVPVFGDLSPCRFIFPTIFCLAVAPCLLRIVSLLPFQGFFSSYFRARFYVRRSLLLGSLFFTQLLFCGISFAIFLLCTPQQAYRSHEDYCPFA